jgi:hypothetical protein
MVLGCTDVCGTATLEGEKILSEIWLFVGFGMDIAPWKREQLKTLARSCDRDNNLNRDSVLRCGFGKHRRVPR